MLDESIREWPECQVWENAGTNGDLMPFTSLKKKKKGLKIQELCLHCAWAKTETQLNRVRASVEKSKQERDYT